MTPDAQPLSVGATDALADIPDHLLQHNRGSGLETWCLTRGFRPTLAAIEAERRRRLTEGRNAR